MIQVLKKRTRERREAALDDLPDQEDRIDPSLVAVDRLKGVCTSRHLMEDEAADEEYFPVLSESSLKPAEAEAVTRDDAVPAEGSAQQAEAAAQEADVDQSGENPAETSVGTPQDSEEEVSDQPVEKLPLLERRFPNPDVVAKRPLSARAEPRREEGRLSFVDAMNERRAERAKREAVGNLKQRGHGKQPAKIDFTQNDNRESETDMTTNPTKTKANKTTAEEILDYLNDNNASVLSEGVNSVGNIDTDRNVVVFGTHDGNLSCRHLIVGPTGAVNGAVDAEVIENYGHMAGEITANRVSAYESSLIEGELMCLSFSQEHGACINATLKVIRAEDLQNEGGSKSQLRRYPTVGVSGALARKLIKSQGNS